MAVVNEMSPEVRTAGNADERIGGVFGNLLASVDLRSVIGNLPRDRSIVCQERCCESGEGSENLRIWPVQMKRCCPELFLVEREMFDKGLHQPIFRIDRKSTRLNSSHRC